MVSSWSGHATFFHFLEREVLFHVIDVQHFVLFLQFFVLLRVLLQLLAQVHVLVVQSGHAHFWYLRLLS